VNYRYTLYELLFFGNSEDEIMMIIPSTCFAKGTLITAEKGHIPIEEIQPGDKILTATRGYQPVRWIGWRDVDLASLTGQVKIQNQPVLISASAFGKDVPSKDLILSAAHGIVVRGRLVPAANFVNGRNIINLHNLVSITYYHIEFDEYDMIFANDLPTESFVDVGNRYLFENYIGNPAGINLHHAINVVNCNDAGHYGG
jgi:Hint domain